jgi:hypothetical protein
MIHAPVQPFFGNWLYWQAAALAPNVAPGCAPWLCLGRCAAPAASGCGCGWPSSTSPPGWSGTAGGCTWACPRLPTPRCWAASYWGAALAAGIPSASLSAVLNQLVHDGLVIRIEHGTHRALRVTDDAETEELPPETDADILRLGRVNPLTSGPKPGPQATGEDHYAKRCICIQPIEYIEANALPFHDGNVVK